MTREEVYAHDGTKKFTLVSLFKLTGLIAVFMAIGVATESPAWGLLVIASISLFLAEHFAHSRRSEFFFLAGLPALGWIIFAVIQAIPLLSLIRLENLAESMGAVFATVSLAGTFGVVTSTVSVVAVCVFCGVFYKLTGIRLLKFDWREGTE